MQRGEEQAGLQRSGTKSRDRNTRAVFCTETLNPDRESFEESEPAVTRSEI